MSLVALNRLPEQSEPPPQPRKKLNLRRETIYTWMGLIFTIAASVMVERDIDPIVRARIASGSGLHLLDDACMAVVIYYLIFGTLLYMICRLGYLKRLRMHRPATREELEAIYEPARAPSLTVLVPSYKEEETVVRQTLMSAALMEYPERTIVLLIDDPPDSRDREAMAALVRMRALPREIQALLRTQKRRFVSELDRFERRMSSAVNLVAEHRRIAKLYREVALWMERQAGTFEAGDHNDKLFIQRILLEPARAHRARAQEISACAGHEPLRAPQLLREYRRLAAIFGARLASFERKRFVNLSHAPNKAMNLNSYLGLMGADFREVIRPDGLYLEECEPALARLRVPMPEYVITLDADSLLLPEYALRLVRTMEQPEGRRYAVVQTPYTAVPGSASVLERTAGAQTDLQWLAGQGATYFGATFWVGASAVLRRKALEDIRRIEYERGHPIKKYIRDWTLVEDSESTVDLIAAGWELHNYPDRLCYSATPRDFGSLVIQRRRWANGGLLILPKLIRHLLGKPGRLKRLPETVVRIQYLFSTPAVNLAMLSLVLVRFEDDMPCLWLALTPIAYYLLYGRDLVANNYRWRDLPRVFALNLLLIPVTLGGVARSIEQWWTGRPSPFVRTPKVHGRTSAPALYILATWAILWYTYVEALLDMRDGMWFNALFGIINALTFAYALIRFVGLRRALEDLWANLSTRVRPAWTRLRARRSWPRTAELGARP